MNPLREESIRLTPTRSNPTRSNTARSTDVDRSSSHDQSGANAFGMRSVASAALVNRTHRVIHERARNLQARRSALRSLWIPLVVSGGLLAAIICAIWVNLDEYEMNPTGLPDANQQLLVLGMWCLPVSALLLAIVWLRRGGNKAESGRAG
jgi:hypothetical protein